MVIGLAGFFLNISLSFSELLAVVAFPRRRRLILNYNKHYFDKVSVIYVVFRRNIDEYALFEQVTGTGEFSHGYSDVRKTATFKRA